MINVLLPCVMLSLLTLLVFRMPPDAGEKVSLSITVLLSFTVFMLMVSDNMPQTSNHIPILGKIYDRSTKTQLPNHTSHRNNLLSIKNEFDFAMFIKLLIALKNTF